MSRLIMSLQCLSNCRTLIRFNTCTSVVTTGPCTATINDMNLPVLGDISEVKKEGPVRRQCLSVRDFVSATEQVAEFS